MKMKIIGRLSLHNDNMPFEIAQPKISVKILGNKKNK
jgi:hypothetical protein